MEPAPGGELGNVCGNVAVCCRCFVEDIPVTVPHWAHQTRKHWQPLKLSSVVGVSVGPCAFISVLSESFHYSAKRGGQYNFEAAVVFNVYDSGCWLCVHFFVLVFGFCLCRGGFDLWTLSHALDFSSTTFFKKNENNFGSLRSRLKPSAAGGIILLMPPK